MQLSFLVHNSLVQRNVKQVPKCLPRKKDLVTATATGSTTTTAETATSARSTTARGTTETATSSAGGTAETATTTGSATGYIDLRKKVARRLC